MAKYFDVYVSERCVTNLLVEAETADQAREAVSKAIADGTLDLALDLDSMGYQVDGVEENKTADHNSGAIPAEELYA